MPASAATMVAGTVAHFQRAMVMDADQAAKATRDEEMAAEIEDLLEGFISRPTAACGSMASGSLPGHPSTGGPGTAGRMPSGSAIKPT
jgi:hypothetical protein